MPVITEDLPCDICAYNLKGIDDAGNCPECGQPVARTLNAALHLSDPGWLRYQAKTMLLLCSLCLIMFRHDGFFLSTIPYFVGMLVTQGVVSCAMVWACWRMATPEPPLPPSESQSAVHRALRFLPSVVAAYFLVSNFRRSLAADLMNLMGIAAVVAMLITLWLIVLQVLRFARRSREHSLILHARVLVWAFPLSQLLLVGSSVILRWVPYPTEFLGILFLVLNWGIACCTVGFALLLGRMHEQLIRAAGEAEKARPSVEPSVF